MATKIGQISFDDSLLDAIRDDRLVIFAGAGVSMGSPSLLPDFKTLANDIAKGTNFVAEKDEPLDRFLGRMHHHGVRVHERAADYLQTEDSSPSALHQDLLRLFRHHELVRLVTTNFDHHFETAAERLYGVLPEVFRAPALPLGTSFRGIVHVHGSISNPGEMVLTDADFGRAYLTEGWARRFLVDVFRQHTVLFVGYSYDDTVMKYLTRALAPDSNFGRFILTESVDGWDIMGVKPVHFNKSSDADPHRELNDGVRLLAQRTGRGALDWQTRIAELCDGRPPIDEEAISEVEQALRTVSTTRFFTDVARAYEWPKWVKDRGYLAALFEPTELCERDALIASWLATHYVLRHPETIFDLFIDRELNMNPQFWTFLCREVGQRKAGHMSAFQLTRMVAMLLATAPQSSGHYLLSLAEQCAARGMHLLVLRIFLRMGEYDFSLETPFVARATAGDQDGSQWGVKWKLGVEYDWLKEVWEKHLKTSLAEVAQPLVFAAVQRLEALHRDLQPWGGASSSWDPISYNRSAIEPHEQNSFPDSVDVIIDATRDALEWLAEGASDTLKAWIEIMLASNVPILRRMAIHVSTLCKDLSADARLHWMLERVGLHNWLERHEVYRLAAMDYRLANTEVRRAVIDAVMEYRFLRSDVPDPDQVTNRVHFDWLSWLQIVAPDCDLVMTALTPIRKQYPEWKPSEHPDFNHWSGSTEWVGHESPYSVEELLAMDIQVSLDVFLTFRGNVFEGPDRDGLLATIQKACERQPGWGLALADALVKESEWSSDLWPCLLRGWQAPTLTFDDWLKVLVKLEMGEIHKEYPHDVARLLECLVNEEPKPFSLELLERANNVAAKVWETLSLCEHTYGDSDWLSRAINHPAGVLSIFLVRGLLFVLTDKSGVERKMPEQYLRLLTMVVTDSTLKGDFGRSVLASQTGFFFGLDELWTREHILPLFTDKSDERFGQAWDGFLTWGRTISPITSVLGPILTAAINRLNVHGPQSRELFVKLYTDYMVFHVDDPTEEFIPGLFECAILDDRLVFANRVAYLLRRMDADAKRRLCERWLLRYWRNRLRGVPRALEQLEIVRMLEWSLYLDGSFPEAVELILCSPHVKADHFLLHRLADSDLVARFPGDMARLVIYLCKDVSSYPAGALGKVCARLSDLDPALKMELDEVLALVGVSRLNRADSG